MMVANIIANKTANGVEEDWQLPLAFMKKHHTEAIEGVNAITQTWRMKERVS